MSSFSDENRTDYGIPHHESKVKLSQIIRRHCVMCRYYGYSSKTCMQKDGSFFKIQIDPQKKGCVLYEKNDRLLHETRALIGESKRLLMLP